MNRTRRLATLVAAMPMALLLALGLSGTANALSADGYANVEVNRRIIPSVTAALDVHVG